jgi:hypothetical protein
METDSSLNKARGVPDFKVVSVIQMIVADRESKQVKMKA